MELVPGGQRTICWRDTKSHHIEGMTGKRGYGDIPFIFSPQQKAETVCRRERVVPEPVLPPMGHTQSPCFSPAVLLVRFKDLNMVVVSLRKGGANPVGAGSHVFRISMEEVCPYVFCLTGIFGGSL